jgi:hypothetical protein
MTIQEFLRDYDIRYWRNSTSIGWLISSKQKGLAKGFGFNTDVTDGEFQFFTGCELQNEAAEFLWPFIQETYDITIE